MHHPFITTRKTLTCAVAACLPLLATATAAQQLEEVLVTAQKRVESLMDVPISVSALTGQKIADAGIQRSEDLAAYVPNFQVTQDPIGDKINIRGIQSGNQAGFEQSVATFVDGIYRGRGTQARWSFLDVARVEVLRGPQPTLFGKNTVAGALNITTARPTEEFESELTAGYNIEFDETELQAMVSGPLSDTLRARAVIQSREMKEGWVENAAYDEDNPASEELFGRLSLEWDVGPDTTLFMKYEAGDFDVTGNPWVMIEGGPLSPILAAAGVPTGAVFKSYMGNNGFPLLGFPGDDVIDFGSVGSYEGDTQELMVQLEHQFDSGTVLTAIAGYSEYEYERFLDADQNPLPVVRFDDTEDFDQTSLELRLTSDTGGALEYIAGLYYQDNNMYVDGLTQFNLGTIDTLLGGSCASVPGGSDSVIVGDPVGTAVTVAGLPGANAAVANACAQTALTQLLLPAGVTGATRYAFLDQETETLAAFTQLTWNMTDTFRTTLGLRYTQEEKEAHQGAWAGEYAERNTTPLADQSAANPQALAAFLIGEFTYHEFTPNDPGLSRDEDSFTWSLNAQWDATDNTMVYASAATGFKAGGFNSFFMGLPQGRGADSNDVDFDEEEVLSFEVGAKISLLDGGAELSIAAFHTTYDDLQASIFSGNTTFIVQNAAEATSQGIEIDGRWQVSDKLMVQGSLGWLDFEYDSFSNQGCVAEQFLGFREDAFQSALAVGDQVGAGVASLVVNNQTCSAAGVNDMQGRPSAHSPEWTAAFVANYNQPIGEYELDASVDVSWSDDVYRQDDLDPYSLLEAYTKVNMALVFGPSNGRWDVSLIGKNLTDEDTYSYVNDTPLFNGARQARMDQPRSFAVRGRYRF
ncbi:MAG: TonB-dependent receptor [Halieaceae bacterium]|jgi:iron complex outermembrane recepter protein|nr:TonB-dependent receptor [Halieaceae bacterium]